MSYEIIFWLSVSLLFYTHIGYPLLLWWWARVYGRVSRAQTYRPAVSVLVIAHNESARIEARIENLLNMDYPRDRLEIIVASDGSDDDTFVRAARYRQAGVFVVAFRQRRGKSAVLNDLVPQASGEIVVLADARQRFNRDAIAALTAHFADPAVGAVSGELILTVPSDGAAGGEGVGFYWQYEKFIRRRESGVDSTVGVTGAIYAIRRELFKPIAREIILDDVLIPMNIVRRGYRVVFESRAQAYDRVSTAEAEFRRKTRTLAGNFQLFVRESWLLNPLRNRLWLQTVSHKLFRLLGPPALLSAFIANLFLLDQTLYRFTLLAQLAFYLAAGLGYVLRRRAAKIRVANLAYAFCLLNWAVVVGFVQFIRGRQRVTWQRTSIPQTADA